MNFTELFKGETVDGDRCLAFSHGGVSYEEGKCRYTYVHNKTWCYTAENNSKWGYCSTDGCTNDYFEACLKVDSLTFTKRSNSNLYYHWSGDGKQTYENAVARCAAASSKLAYANTSQEFQVIKEILPRYNQSQVWIGVKKTLTNPPSLFWTADNSAYQFGNDTPASINGQGTSCAALIRSGSYSFNDVACETENSFICQRDCTFNPYQQCKYNFQVVSYLRFKIYF